MEKGIPLQHYLSEAVHYRSQSNIFRFLNLSLKDVSRVVDYKIARHLFTIMSLSECRHKFQTPTAEHRTHFFIQPDMSYTWKKK